MSKLCSEKVMTHIVFDSHVAQSLKECERNNYRTVPPIFIIDMTPDTLIPQQI